MKENGLQIEILPYNYFLDENGILRKDDAINLSGKIAGVCYNKEGFKELENEPQEKTDRRINMTLGNGHLSVYDHTNINFNMHNIPKILAMILNNEKQYTTSEKSARYTKVEKKESSIITDREVNLYNKWIDILEKEITKKYGNVHDSRKIKKLAQENARYMVTVFMPTEMIYTTTLRQINYIQAALDKYQKTLNTSIEFDGRLSNSINEFRSELQKLNVLDDKLMANDKNRKISLFGENLSQREKHFGDVYSTTYKGTYAELAQAQRHRTLNYQMEKLDEKSYFIPPIIICDEELSQQWIEDIDSVKDITPQGEKILIHEAGTYDNFILKCKERLCSCAQLEINDQTKKTLMEYRKALIESNSYLKDDIEKYSHGARCTFPDYKCSSDCKNNEGKTLVRKI